jgi:mercuric ion transport protein
MLPLQPAKALFLNVMAGLIGRRVDLSESKRSRGALALGGLAAILASTCCLGPLVLVALGFSGAWIGTLTVLEPYRPLFIGAALVAMAFAYRRIFRPARACEPGDVCAVPKVRTTYKVIFWAVAALVLVALAFPYVLPLFY